MPRVRYKLSIRNRLLLQLGAVACLLSFSLFLLVKQVIDQAVTATQDGLLNAAIQSVVDKITVIDDQISLDLPYDTFSLLGAVGEDRIFYLVSVDSVPLTGYEDFPYTGGFGDLRNPVFGDVTYLNETFRSVAIENSIFAQNQTRQLTIIIAQSQNFQASVQSYISQTLTWIILAFLVIAIVCAYLTANLTIRPIDRFAMDVTQRGPNDLRKVSEDVPHELQPLAYSLNGFISRFRAALKQTETFIAEAAHHIRTPLAIVKSESELALRKSKNPENRDHLRHIIQAVDRTNRSATQLLDHAMVLYRIERPETQPVSLHQVIKDMVYQFRPVAAMRDLDLRYTCDMVSEGTVILDRVLLETAIRNLLDNALKYAPSESEVQVILTQGTGSHRAMPRSHAQYDISIVNYAVGPDTVCPSRMVKKFQRGAHTDDSTGSGLGLSIVTEVAEAIQATFAIEKTNRGTICARLSLSCA